MPDLTKRSYEKEWMDDLQAGGPEIIQTLKELEFINQWLGGNHVTTNGLNKLIGNSEGQITVADMGCGGGDMLKLIAQWGRKNGLKLHLFGVDANANIINYAKNNCRDYQEIEFIVEDIFSPAFASRSFDVITNTLFTHHFHDDQLIALYSQWRQQANKGIVINDLHRHPVAYYAIKGLTQAFSRSAMVKNDAPLSVARGFKKADLAAILLKAGISNYQLNWMWAFRWQLIIK